MTEDNMTVTLDTQERSTVLAALRYFQHRGMGTPQNMPDWLFEIASDGDDHITLDNSAIDAICERINYA